MSEFENNKKNEQNSVNSSSEINTKGSKSMVPPAFNASGDGNDDILSKMGAQFGADFSNVNIHKGSNKAKGMNARAYTQGYDVHFAPGEYNPSSSAGQELIGHELTHVVQQSAGKVKANKSVNGQAVNDSPELEAEADKMGGKAAQGSLVGSGMGGNNGSSSGVSQMKSNVVQRTEDLDANIMGVQVRRTLRNVDSGTFNADTFSHILQSILQVNGSSINASLEIGLAAVRELGIGFISIGEVAAGVKILLEASAEIKHDGKFSLKGSAGITGFVSGEISGLLSGNVEAGATVELEGEWDSVAHFGAYVYQQIHEKAREAVNAIEAQGFGEYVPGSLRTLANAPDSTLGQRSPEVTATARAHAGAGASLGGEDAGFAVGGAAQVSAETFRKSRDGVTTETGTVNKTSFTGSLDVGSYGLSVNVENAVTNSENASTQTSSTKEEEKWTLELTGAMSSLDESEIRSLAQLPRGMAAVTSVADSAISLGRNIASRLSDSVASGPASLNRAAGSSAALIFEVKFEIGANGRELKEITIARKAAIEQSASLQVPAGGAVDVRGSATFSGSLVRTIFHASF